MSDETYESRSPHEHHWTYQLSANGVWVAKCTMCPTMTVDILQPMNELLDMVAQTVELNARDEWTLGRDWVDVCAEIIRSFKKES
jgi:hypothetical protein